MIIRFEPSKVKKIFSRVRMTVHSSTETGDRSEFELESRLSRTTCLSRSRGHRKFKRKPSKLISNAGLFCGSGLLIKKRKLCGGLGVNDIDHGEKLAVDKALKYQQRLSNIFLLLLIK